MNVHIMVFGVFDLLHEGHRDFLRQAAQQGTRLTAVVTRDRMVHALKGKMPHEHEEARLQKISAIAEVADAVLGDAGIGSYEVIKKYKPDMICLGYDQSALAEDLERKMNEGALSAIPITRLNPHEPERWHTSLLTKQKTSA